MPHFRIAVCVIVQLTDDSRALRSPRYFVVRVSSQFIARGYEQIFAVQRCTRRAAHCPLRRRRRFDALGGVPPRTIGAASMPARSQERRGGNTIHARRPLTMGTWTRRTQRRSLRPAPNPSKRTVSLPAWKAATTFRPAAGCWVWKPISRRCSGGVQYPGSAPLGAKPPGGLFSPSSPLPRAIGC